MTGSLSLEVPSRLDTEAVAAVREMMGETRGKI